MKKFTDHKSKLEFGKKFKEAREKRSLSQVQVADMVGIHFNYYARIERGNANPSFDKILKIAEVLKVKL